MNDEAKPADSTSTRGHSLGALFLLTGACGVLFAMIVPLRHPFDQGQIGANQLLGSMIGGSVMVGVLGIIVGLHHVPQIWGCLIGALAGLLVGAAVGPLVLVPFQQVARVMVIALSGSAVLIVSSVVLRLASKKT